MDAETAARLIELNTAFYAQVGESFSQTRQAPWPGWQRSFDACMGDAGFAQRATRGLRVADVACGNMRYLAFLREALAQAGAAPVHAYVGVDNCTAMAPSEAACGCGDASSDFPQSVRFEFCDLLSADADAVADAVADADPVDTHVRLSEAVQGAAFDLVACFGFFHHIPGRPMRAAFLQELANLVQDGGMLIISLWRFLENEQLASKAAHTTEAAFEMMVARPSAAASLPYGIRPEDLEENDCLLGWQDTCGVFRYCHSFSERDEQELIAAAESMGLRLLVRFRADGRTDDLNTYLVFQAAAR